MVGKWCDSELKFMKGCIERQEMTVEADGAVKWNSNGNYWPADVCDQAIYLGFTDFSVEATAKKRDAQTEAFFREYRERMKNYKPSAEELAEMRNAFGPGATVVNVITGQTYRV